MLAFAEAIVASEQCPQCGRPKWVCQNDDDDIDFRVYDEECNAMARKALHDKRKKDDKAGVITGIEHYTYSRTDVAAFRTPWIEARRKKTQEREEARPVREREHPPGWSPETLDSAP